MSDEFATPDIAWTCPNCGRSGRTTLTHVLCTCGTMSEGVWSLTYEGHKLYLTYVEYRELKRLAFDEPSEAAVMARRILDGQEERRS